MAICAPYDQGTVVFAAAAVVSATLAAMALALAAPPTAFTVAVPIRQRRVSVVAVAMFVETPQRDTRMILPATRSPAGMPENEIPTSSVVTAPKDVLAKILFSTFGKAQARPVGSFTDSVFGIALSW